MGNWSCYLLHRLTWRLGLNIISEGGRMIKVENGKYFLVGPKGKISIDGNDEISLKFGMLYEGECEGRGATSAAKKFGYSRQRYYQILKGFKENGAETLKKKKTGPKRNYRRTDEAVRQVIRHKFLDPRISPEVISQKLKQCGHPIRTRSVERVISEFGLQKKTPHVSSRETKKRGKDRNP